MGSSRSDLRQAFEAGDSGAPRSDGATWSYILRHRGAWSSLGCKRGDDRPAIGAGTRGGPSRAAPILAEHAAAQEYRYPDVFPIGMIRRLASLKWTWSTTAASQ